MVITKMNAGNDCWTRSLTGWVLGTALVLFFFGDCVIGCPPPTVPENGYYKCLSLCASYGPSTKIEYFCQSGYVLSTTSKYSVCRRGRWSSGGSIVCRPVTGFDLPSDSGSQERSELSSIPVVAATAVAVSVFLLTAMVCVMIKPKVHLCQCQRQYRALFDDDPPSIAGRPVTLPSYEEAVYGNQGNLVPPLQGQTIPLIFAEEQTQQTESSSPSGMGPVNQTANQTVELLPPPPSYEETQSATWMEPSNTEQGRTRHSHSMQIFTLNLSGHSIKEIEL